MMTHTKTLLTAFAASAMLAASSAQAAVIAEYTFSSSDGTSTDTETNSTATDFAGGTFEQIVTSGAITRASETTDSVAGAINEDDFYSFTVTPNATPAPGFEMNLTSLTFDGQHNAVTGDPVITNESISLFWRSSVDGFASNIGSTFTFAWNQNDDGLSVDLSGSEFQGLTTATTFRIYAFDSGFDNVANGIRTDNVRLNGEVVPVPEPGSLALLGMLGLGLLGFRRRR